MIPHKCSLLRSSRRSLTMPLTVSRLTVPHGTSHYRPAGENPTSETRASHRSTRFAALRHGSCILLLKLPWHHRW